MDPLCISENDYVSQRVGPAPTASFIRATAGMSGIALKRAQLNHRDVLTEWQRQRDAARLEYRELLEAGEIIAPTRTQQLIKTARGHPDNEGVQAARRLLAKRSIAWD